MATPAVLPAVTATGTENVDGVSVANTPSAVAAGHAFRQSVALGDGTVGGNLMGVDSQGRGLVLMAPYAIAPVTSGSNVSEAATYIVGWKNNSTTAQTITGTLYDNPSAGSGTVVDTLTGGAGATQTLGPMQVIEYPAPGLPLASGGFTFVPSGAPSGNGIQILYRL